LDLGWKPVPKPVSKPKDKPKIKKKRYPTKKKKKPQTVKGRTIPTKRTRGRITAAEYNEALRQHGEYCWVCGTPVNLECHHVVPKGYSRIRNGRGVWRNLRFLCSEHHRGKTGVHQNRELMEELQQLHEGMYGKYFYMDRFDLFSLGLIPNTTKEAYEVFMIEQEKGNKSPI
jgi:hypothetical protein